MIIAKFQIIAISNATSQSIAILCNTIGATPALERHKIIQIYFN